MIHRDIKPGNILLTKRGQAVVADFGIARIVGSTQHTAAGALMGTLNYIAPEQGLQGQSDARSDIYSLGIVFYEMLTQRTPFDADTPLAILMKHVNDPLPLPRRINPSIPESFERIVLRALAKNPDDRFQSAEEMAQALREAAVEAEIEMPSRISLPFSFTTTEAPAESVAVFSGTARERLSDAEFADDDTDTTLGQRLAKEDDGEAERDVPEHAVPHPEHVKESQAIGVAGKELLGAVGAVANVALGKMTQALREATGKIEEASARLEPDVESDDRDVPESPAAPSSPAFAAGQAARGKKKRRRSSGGLSILGAIGLLVMGNVCLLTIAVPMDWWDIYDVGWPIQIFLLSWGLCMIMFVTSSIWMLIPTGLMFVTGIILTYCQLTGNWDYWSFLWIFEAWGGILSILVPIFLARSEGLARFSSRFLAVLLSLVSIVAIIFVGLSVGAGNLFVNWGNMLMP